MRPIEAVTPKIDESENRLRSDIIKAYPAESWPSG